jgi:hypothetical protein
MKVMAGWFRPLIVAVAVLSPLHSALSAVWVRVPDVSLLRYQTYPDGKVWFRNFQSFDGNAQNSNYAYYIDTTTAEGKSILALMMAASAQNRGLWFGLPDGYVAGQVSYVGDW